MNKRQLARRLAKAPALSNNHFVVLRLKIEAIEQYLLELPLEGSEPRGAASDEEPPIEAVEAEGEAMAEVVAAIAESESGPPPPEEEPEEGPEPVVEEEQPDYTPPSSETPGSYGTPQG